MEVKTQSCDICRTLKSETNHWIDAILRPGWEGILFQPAECTEEPHNPLFIYEHLCGLTCAAKRLSRWRDELKEVITING